MSSLLTIATAIALIVPGCSGFTSHPSQQLTRSLSAQKPSPSAVHVLPDSIIETTSQIVSVLPDSMSSPESARGYFGLWFFGGQGGATVALSRAPAQIAKFKKLYSMSDEGPTLGGETVGVSPICLYPRDICKADIDKVLSNKLSVEQMVEKGPKPTYLSENGYLNYASFVDANKGCNPLTVRAVFDSFATSDNVAPDVAQQAIDEFKADPSGSAFKNGLLKSKLAGWASLAFLAFLLGPIVGSTCLDAGAAGWFPDWPGRCAYYYRDSLYILQTKLCSNLFVALRCPDDMPLSLVVGPGAWTIPEYWI